MATMFTNIPGTRGLRCCCVSWRAHWENGAGQPLTSCSVSGCRNDAHVGAHVHLWPDFLEAIVPLCRSHNHPSKGLMALKRGRWAVNADAMRTCCVPYDAW